MRFVAPIGRCPPRRGHGDQRRLRRRDAVEISDRDGCALDFVHALRRARVEVTWLQGVTAVGEFAWVAADAVAARRPDGPAAPRAWPRRPPPGRAGARRPSAISRSSTAPSRPSNVVHTGVPSATASRFIVPPAEITRSAYAISDCASIARSGTMKPPAAPARRAARACAAARRSGLARAAARAPRANSGVLEAVVERHGRRRAHDDDRLRRVEPQLAEHRRVGLEVRQVVLLLEPRVAAQLAASRRSGASRSGGITSGTTTACASRQLTVCCTVAHS